MSARPVVKTSFMDGPMQEAAIMAAQVSKIFASIENFQQLASCFLNFYKLFRGY